MSHEEPPYNNDEFYDDDNFLGVKVYDHSNPELERVRMRLINALPLFQRKWVDQLIKLVREDDLQ